MASTAKAKAIMHVHVYSVFYYPAIYAIKLYHTRPSPNLGYLFVVSRKGMQGVPIILHAQRKDERMRPLL